MLLPKAFGGRVKPDVLLAFETGGAKIVGAAAYSLEQDQASLIGVRVVRPHRRQGIGTELLRQVVKRARDKQRWTINAGIDAMIEREAESFLTANRFARISRLHVLETDLEPMRAAMEKLLERARRSRRLPESARIVHPSQAPAKELTRIYDEQITTLRRLHPAIVEASLTEEQYEYPSSVLLIDEKVAAMVMVYYDMEHRRAIVPAKAVLEGFRGGLANIWVMADALEKGRAAGIERIRFEAMEENNDTRKLARRFRGETIHLYDRYRREVGAGEAIQE